MKSKIFSVLNPILRFLTTYFIFEIRYKRLLREARIYSKGKLLDVGCGSKPYKNYFKVKEYIGVDTPYSEIKSRDVDIFSSGLDLSFKNKQFDTVLCTEVLEHVNDPEKLLSEINRVLKTQGKLILTTPFILGLHGEPYDYFRYTKHGLTCLLERGGFRVLYTKNITGSFGAMGLFSIITIANSYKNSRSKKKVFLLRMSLMWIMFLLQIIFSLVDKLNGYKGDTTDTIVVAKKLNIS